MNDRNTRTPNALASGVCQSMPHEKEDTFAYRGLFL